MLGNRCYVVSYPFFSQRGLIRFEPGLYLILQLKSGKLRQAPLKVRCQQAHSDYETCRRKHRDVSACKGSEYAKQYSSCNGCRCIYVLYKYVGSISRHYVFDETSADACYNTDKHRKKQTCICGCFKGSHSA